MAAPVGQITEFSAGLQAGNRSFPVGIAPGPDGNMWFTDTRAIGRVTPSGQITEFSAGLQASSGSVPAEIAPGADGNMWFTDEGCNGVGRCAVGRITPSGRVTEFSAGLQTGNRSSPAEIALGRDGNVWFADPGVTKAIGRITPSGRITEFSAGVQAGNRSFPADIAPGIDGNMWFTDLSGTRAIGRITPSGQITEFAAGLQAGSGPEAIAPGPDGNMWFTDTRAIGRVTPSGQITEFSAGLQANSEPAYIAPGADGNVWFTDEGCISGGTCEIGRITPRGTITEFSAGLQTGSGPLDIAPGADGNLWFTDNGAQTIGRIGAGAPAASVLAPSVAGSGQQGTQQVCEGSKWADWAGQKPLLNVFPFDGYRWLRHGSPIAGQTGQTYTPTRSDVGHELSCRVTVTYPLFDVTDSATSVGVTGKVEVVTCKTVTETVTRHGKTVKLKRRKCTTRLVGGPLKFKPATASARATLSRGRVVYATGYAYHHRGGPRTVLLAPRPLRPGRYTLTLTRQRGGHTVRTRTQITIT